MNRVDVKGILRDRQLRKELSVRVIIATQAREGIVTTREQAEQAYEAVQKELSFTPRVVTVLLLVLLAFASPALAQERGPLLLTSYAGFATAQALDVHSTTVALRRPGVAEANGLLARCAPSVPCLTATKAALTVGVLYVVDQHVRPRSKTAAVLLMTAATSVQLYIDIRNYRTGTTR